MKAEDVNELIGLPYLLGGKGPEAFDCRGLLVYIQRKFFNHDLPDLPDGAAMRQMYERKLEQQVWQLVASPVHGDGVILRGGNFPHVGVYLITDEPGAVHSLEGVGVIWTPTRHFRKQGFSRAQYIRFTEPGTV